MHAKTVVLTSALVAGFALEGPAMASTGQTARAQSLPAAPLHTESLSAKGCSVKALRPTYSYAPPPYLPVVTHRFSVTCTNDSVIKVQAEAVRVHNGSKTTRSKELVPVGFLSAGGTGTWTWDVLAKEGDLVHSRARISYTSKNGGTLSPWSGWAMSPKIRVWNAPTDITARARATHVSPGAASRS